jgi:transposase
MEKARFYSEEFKQEVLRIISTEGIYSTEASRRFGIANESTVRGWIKKYNPEILPLNRIKKTFTLKNNSKDESIEAIQLKKKIKEIEKSLEYSELKAEAYSTMIDIAEKELKINIRKKLNTKQ